MLSDRLGLPAAVPTCSRDLTERWDGTGVPGVARASRSRCRARSSTSPATRPSSACLGGADFGRAGDPQPGRGRLRSGHRGALSSTTPAGILAVDSRRLGVGGDARRRAAAAADARGRGRRSRARRHGAFADLASPYLRRPLGRRRRVRARGRPSAAALGAAGRGRRAPRGARPRPRSRRRPGAHLAASRAADPGRLGAGPAARRTTPSASSSRSPFLAALAPVAARPPRAPRRLAATTAGAAAAALPCPRALLAAADAYHAMTEPRPHREPLSPDRGRRDPRARGRAPADWTPTRSPPCSRRPASPSRGSGDQRV